MTKAVYPGTFDPVTNGHLDIIERASDIFDELTVAVTDAPDKDPYFGLKERERFLQQCTTSIGNCEVTVFQGLLVDFCEEVGAGVIVRGLRETNDFLNEYQMALMNRLQAGEIETVFLAASSAYHFVSSSLIREVATLGGEIDKLVPRVVVDAFGERLES